VVIQRFSESEAFRLRLSPRVSGASSATTIDDARQSTTSPQLTNWSRSKVAMTEWNTEDLTADDPPSLKGYGVVCALRN